mgnify:FL=1
MAQDPYIKHVYGYIIPKSEGKQVTRYSLTENLGAWNETRSTIDHGVKSIDWEATIRARASNAPALYAGAGLLAAYGLVKVFK